MQIYNIFKKNLTKKNNKIFIKIEKKKYTHQDVENFINIIEKKISIINGNAIAIIEHNNIYHVAIYLLCSKLNSTFVALDPNSPADVLDKQLKISEAKLLFCNNVTRRKIKNFSKTKKNYDFFDLGKKKYLPSLKKNKKIKKHNNIFLLSFTSGSTGDPKPIILTEKTKVLRAKSNISLYSLNKIKKTLISTPLHHTLAIRILTISIILGTELHIMNDYYTDKFLKTISRSKIDFTIFISSQINQIVKKISNIKYLKSLKSIISSSGNLSSKIKKKLCNLFKGKIFECYGLSEAAILTNLDLKKNKKQINSVGKPIKGVKIKILKNTKNKKIGEILFRSKFIFSGYFKNPAYTKKCFHKKYFKTGDLGYIKNNYLFYVGRKKNMAKINGISVYPEDIENKLFKSKIVKDCAVTFFTEENEEKLCLAYKSKKINIKLEEKIKNFCFKRLSPFQIPRYFIRFPKIPRNNIGKINRLALNTLAKRAINV